MQRNLRIPGAAFLALVFTACAPSTPTPAPPAPPAARCRLPCWAGITVGATSHADAVAALNKYYAGDALKIDDQAGGLIWHTGGRADGVLTGYLTFDAATGRVSRLSVPLLADTWLTAGLVAADLGDPPEIVFGAGQTASGCGATPGLAYRALGVTAWVGSEHAAGSLSHDTPIGVFTVSAHWGDDQVEDKYLQPWKGWNIAYTCQK